jgi:hypothetical protein
MINLVVAFVAATWLVVFTILSGQQGLSASINGVQKELSASISDVKVELAAFKGATTTTLDGIRTEQLRQSAQLDRLLKLAERKR